MSIKKPQDWGISLVVISSIFIPLDLLATILRLWARILKKKRLEINDYAIFVGTVSVEMQLAKVECLTDASFQVLAIANASLTIAGKINHGYLKTC